MTESVTGNYTQQIKEAAEAICGALHRLNFEFIGESADAASTWFHRGEHPNDVRVEVLRSALAPMVLVNLEWRTVKRERGRQTLQVDVRGAPRDVFMATEQAVLRCLYVFRDVLEGTGVALGEPKQTKIDSNDMPETPNEEREAGLTDDDQA